MSSQIVVLGTGLAVLLAFLLTAFRRRARHTPGRARRGHTALRWRTGRASQLGGRGWGQAGPVGPRGG